MISEIKTRGSYKWAHYNSYGHITSVTQERVNRKYKLKHWGKVWEKTEYRYANIQRRMVNHFLKIVKDSQGIKNNFTFNKVYKNKVYLGSSQ